MNTYACLWPRCATFGCRFVTSRLSHQRMNRFCMQFPSVLSLCVESNFREMQWALKVKHICIVCNFWILRGWIKFYWSDYKLNTYECNWLQVFTYYLGSPLIILLLHDQFCMVTLLTLFLLCRMIEYINRLLPNESKIFGSLDFCYRECSLLILQ